MLPTPPSSAPLQFKAKFGLNKRGTLGQGEGNVGRGGESWGTHEFTYWVAVKRLSSQKSGGERVNGNWSRCGAIWGLRGLSDAFDGGELAPP